MKLIFKYLNSLNGKMSKYPAQIIIPYSKNVWKGESLANLANHLCHSPKTFDSAICQIVTSQTFLPYGI